NRDRKFIASAHELVVTRTKRKLSKTPDLNTWRPHTNSIAGVFANVVVAQTLYVHPVNKAQAAALGRFLNASYHRVNFLSPGSIATRANSANAIAANSVQSAIVGRSPAIKGRPSIFASTIFATLASRARALSAASAVCFTRCAKNGEVFWKIVAMVPSTP